MSDKEIPATWRIASDYDPNEHMMSLKGKAYLDVANRLLWFVRDQRDFIVRGCATCNYIIRSELVEQDRQAGFAQFKTYVRDVLGNEATMYGSETAKDFGDYAEKASTKSLGRALAMLGYGTAAAPEMDEGDRIVDTPIERKPQPAQPQQRPFTAHPPVIRPAVDEPGEKRKQQLQRQNDAELAEQPWPFLQDVELRNALNKRNIRDVAAVTAFVASATHKLHEPVTYADRDVCLAAATSLEGLAGKR